MLSNQPLYLKIKDDILAKINNRQLCPGDKLPTEQQFMQEYQVSRITVSKALNELKESGILIRYPHKGTFVSDSAQASSPETVSKPLARPAVNDGYQSLTEIALLLPSIPDLFSLTLINSVLSVFPPDQYICHIFRTDSPEKENILLRYCLEKEISGIVLFPQNHIYFDDSLLSMCLSRYPMVLIDRYLPYLDTSYVISDHYMAGSLCIRHLYELGHRQFAFVTICSDLETYSVRRRYEGIRDALQALGLPENAVHLVLNADSEHPKDDDQELFLNLILREHVTAIITSESNLCSYLFDLYQKNGYRIPDQLSLMTFDQPIHSTLNHDFFTHINQVEYQIGREAGILLKNRIEQQDTATYHRVITPALSIHSSTGPAPRL